MASWPLFSGVVSVVGEVGLTVYIACCQLKKASATGRLQVSKGRMGKRVLGKMGSHPVGILLLHFSHYDDFILGLAQCGHFIFQTAMIDGVFERTA